MCLSLHFTDPREPTHQCGVTQGTCTKKLKEDSAHLEMDRSNPDGMKIHFNMAPRIVGGHFKTLVFKFSDLLVFLRQGFSVDPWLSWNSL